MPYDASIAEGSGAAGAVTTVVRSVAQERDLCKGSICESALVRNEAQLRSKAKTLFKSVRIAP